MRLTRRTLLASAAAVLSVGRAARAADPAARLAAEVAAFADGDPVETAAFGVAIDAYVESGYTVPVAVAPAGLAAGERLVALRLFAPENPLIRVATFRFGAMAAGTLATRIRLARSQTVTAVARTSAGRVLRQDLKVAVLVGGCGFDVEEKAG